jgi:serine/threonine protein kinase/tetratricopeptide (TPR) repeat protein
MTNEQNDRLGELFERAIELSPDARERFIEDCTEDPAVRSELRSLVGAFDRTPNLLERLAGEVMPAVLEAVEEDFVKADETSPSSAGMSRPDRIGKYRILEAIGEGGMGIVYLAEQEVPLRRRVAIKVIKVGMDTRQVIARFEAERQALAVMDHPVIATVFDGGATDDGRPYFAMEYVKGEPITKYCDRQRLTTHERLELFIQVCEGVQHAHQKGIIHRDLKPSNVLVTVQDDRPVPKIIDFGVAKATAQPLTEHSLFTELGMIIGTLDYMSPEQAEMGGLDIDTRTDVYALGVILYELLTGALPFDRDARRKASLDDVRRTIREKEPPRPSARVKERGAAAAEAAERRRTEPARLASRLCGDLDFITLRALEKDRTRRYQTANALAMDVRRYLRNEPVSARAPGTLYRMQRFIRRHRVGAAAAAALLVALVLGVAGTTLGLMRARRAEVQAREEAAIASRVSEFLVKLFEVSDPGEARGNSITAREILDRGAEQIRRDLGDQPQVQARLIYTMGKVHDSLGLYNAGAALLEEALKKREALLGPEQPDVAEACDRLGDVYRKQGRYAEAEPLLRRAVAIRERRFPANSPLIADSLTSLGNLYQSMGRFDEAQPVLERALAIRERNAGDDAGLARTLQSVAVLMGRRGKIAEAEPHLRRTLDIQERTMGRDHPDVGKTYTNLANVYMLQNRFAEAEPLYARALEIRRRTLGPRHASVAETLHNMGSLYLEDDRPEAAEPVFREALSIYQQAYGATHRNVALALANLGKILVRQHRYNDAEACYRQALAILEKTLAVDDPYVADTLQDLGELYHELKRSADAEPLFRRSLAIRERVLGADNIATADSIYALGVVLRDEGRAAEALPLLARAFEIRVRERKESDRDRVEVTRDYVKVLRALGRHTEADAVQARGDGPGAVSR